MIPRSVEKFMKEKGFGLVRETHTGSIWSDGLSRIHVGNAVLRGQHNMQNLRAEVKRAVQQRESSPMGANPKQEEKPMKTTIRELLGGRPMTTATPNSIHAPTHENTQPEKKGKGGYKKYDGLTRHKLRKRVLDLYRAGTTNSFEMAEILTKEGLGKQDTGRVEANHVARAIRHWRQMGELPESTPRTRPPRDLPPKTGEASAWTQAQESPTPIKPRASVSPTILSILTDPDLDDTQKVGMIAAYANVKV